MAPTTTRRSIREAARKSVTHWHRTRRGLVAGLTAVAVAAGGAAWAADSFYADEFVVTTTTDRIEQAAGSTVVQDLFVVGATGQGGGEVGTVTVAVSVTASAGWTATPVLPLTFTGRTSVHGYVTVTAPSTCGTTGELTITVDPSDNGLTGGTRGAHTLDTFYLRTPACAPPTPATTTTAVGVKSATDSTTLTSADTLTPYVVTAAVTSSSATTPATGDVEFSYTTGDTTTPLGTDTLVAADAGVATWSVPALGIPAGVHTINAHYVGDGTHGSSDGQAAFEVTRVDTVPTVHLPSGPLYAPVPVTGITATVAPQTSVASPPAATGTVEFFADGASIGTGAYANGVWTLPAHSFTAATHAITAMYSGDIRYAGPQASAAADLTVGSMPTVPSLAILAGSPPAATSSVSLGTGFTLQATVAPQVAGYVPSGDVTFYGEGHTYLGSSPLVDGVATLDQPSAGQPNLAVGTYHFTAEYSGDVGGTYATSVTPAAVPLEVTKLTTTVDLTGIPASIDTTTAFELTATTAATDATGSMTFSYLVDTTWTVLAADVDMTGNAASVPVSGLPAGVTAIKAEYSGDGSYFGASTTATLAGAVTASTTTTTLADPTSPVLRTGAFTLSAGVAPARAGSTAVVSGGTVTFTATQQVPAGATPVVVSWTAPVTSGVATLLDQPVEGVPDLPDGTYAITAVYDGTATFDGGPAVNSVTLVVKKAVPAASVVVTNSPDTTTPVALEATLTFVDGFAASGSVQFAAVSTQDDEDVTPLGDAVPLPANAGGPVTLDLTADAPLDLGTYTITATFVATDGTYTDASAATEAPLTVGLTATSTALAVAPAVDVTTTTAVTLTATVTSTNGSGAVPAGTVEFLVGGLPHDPAWIADLDENGVAELTVTFPAWGTYAITAVYRGDTTTFDESDPSDQVDLPVAVSTSTVELVPLADDEITTADEFSLSSVVGPADATGEVEYSARDAVTGDETSFGTEPVGETRDGLVHVLPAGTYYLDAHYSGDAKYGPSDSTVVVLLKVDPAESTTLLTVAPTSVEGTKTFALTAAVTPADATGSVEFLVDGASQDPAWVADLDGDGVATLTDLPAEGLALTSHAITAVYSGDAWYGSSQGEGALEVTKTATSVALSPESSSTLRTGTFTLTADVTPATAAGHVTVTATEVQDPGDETLPFATTWTDVPVVGGTATLTDDADLLPAGTYAVTAAYDEDAAYFGSDPSTVTLQVLKVTTGVALTVDPDPETLTSTTPFDVVAEVTSDDAAGHATGSVTFSYGAATVSKPLVNGVATLSLPRIPTATSAITATFDETDDYLGSSNTAPLVVGPTSAFVTLDVPAASPVEIGTPVSLTAHVDPADATGIVGFFVGDEPAPRWTAALSDGDATTSPITDLPVGTYSITAQYLGDSWYDPSLVSGSVTLQVVKTPTATATTLTSSPSQGDTSTSFTLTAQVTSATSGDVEFFRGTTSLGTAPVSGGSATLPVGTLAVGSYAFTARYLGDDDYAPSSSGTVTVVVTAKVKTDTIAPFPPLVWPPLGGFIGTATPVVTGTAEPGSTVKVYDGTTVVCTTTAWFWGNWGCVLDPLADGPHTITATATDAAGNESFPSWPSWFTVDTHAPAAPVVVKPIAGSLQTTNSVLVSGTAEPGSTVWVTEGFATYCVAISDWTGKWSCTAFLANGAHNLAVTATDLAFNRSAVTTVSLTVAPPPAPVWGMPGYYPPVPGYYPPIPMYPAYPIW